MIIDAKLGNQIDQDRLLEYTSDTIQKSLNDDFSGSAISVEINTNVYKDASVTETSQKLTSRLTELNSNIEKYNNTTIIYLFGDVSETIDSDTIHSWLIVSEDKIEVDFDKVRAYIGELANKYNTVYVPRSFQTSDGQIVTVNNNEYGFSIDQDADWQSEFGGDVYKTKGSHGCVNLPSDQAEIIYHTIDSGYPIILY